MLLKLRGGRAEAVEGVDISSLVVLEGGGGGCGWVGSGKTEEGDKFPPVENPTKRKIDYY